MYLITAITDLYRDDAVDSNNDVKMTLNRSPSSAIVLDRFLDRFRSIKEATDDLVVKHKTDSYCDGFLPRSDELAIVIFCNAFKDSNVRFDLQHLVQSSSALNIFQAAES